MVSTVPGASSVLEGGGPVHDLGRKGSNCMGSSSRPHACELGLPCKVKKRKMMMIKDGWLKKNNCFPPWLLVDSCSHRMVN